MCAITRSLLTENTTDFDGDWFTIAGAYCEPKPIQSPLPILVGAKGDRMISLAARFADEWNSWGLPDTVAERMAVLDSACERLERDPATIARSTQALVMVTDDVLRASEFVDAVAPRAAIAGTPVQIAEVFAHYVEVGIDEFIVPNFVLGTGARRLEELDALLEAFTPLHRHQ